MLVDAEIDIIDEQRRWADEHLGPRWAPGVRPAYLFLAAKMNRTARTDAITRDQEGRS